MKSLSRSKFRPIILGLLFLLVISLSVSALGINSTLAYEDDADSTLRINMSAFPATLDPQLASVGNEVGHLKLIYEGLTRLNTDLETLPAAAESWAYNLDATEIVFTLREGLTYSDDSVLNAKRFEYSLLRTLDPNLQSPVWSYLADIAGATEYATADVGELDPGELAALRAAVQIKAYTLEDEICTSYTDTECRLLKIGFTHPTTYFHTIMSTWVTYPAKQDLIVDGGDTWWEDPANHIGNGPFVLDTLNADTGTSFNPNSEYWRGTPTYNIAFSYIADPAVALDLFTKNDLDIMPISAAISSTVADDPLLSSQAHYYNGSCTTAVMYHNLVAPFDNPKIRAAFTYAFDRQAWVDEALGGTALPTLTWIPEGMPGYDPTETRWDYDPTAALQALTDSGYTVEDGVLIGPDTEPVEILDSFYYSATNIARHTWLAGQWQEVLGIEITLNPVDMDTYNALRSDLSTMPPIFINGWCADYPDPQNWLSVYWKSNSYFAQRVGYSNSVLDALLDLADATIDPVDRLDLYIDAQKLLIGDVPAAFGWNNINAYLVKDRVKGEVGTPQDSLWMGEFDPLLITLDPVWEHALFLPAIVK